MQITKMRRCWKIINDAGIFYCQIWQMSSSPADHSSLIIHYADAFGRHIDQLRCVGVHLIIPVACG